MNRLRALNETECRILAELEEAGEEGVCTLVNTIFRNNGDQSVVTNVLESILSLHRKGLVGASSTRDEKTLHLVPLNPEAAVNEIALLPEILSWSQKDLYWYWDSDRDDLDIFLTPSGETLAVGLLTKHGWGLVDYDSEAE